MTYGLLNFNKPSGMTSRQAVDRVGRLLGTRRVGHAGTLDPLAAGVLVIAVGAATRLIQYVQQMPKSYLGTFLLGRRSPTEDLEGEVTLLQNPPVPTPEQLSAAARALVGRIEQRPPAYSALKIEGRRAYDLARKGRPVELQPREVMIYRLEIVAYQYPQLVLRVECGSGTYIRSLGRDLAESLGTAAVMSALVRTAVGNFRIEEAADPSQLTTESCQARLEPLVCAVEALPKIVLAAEEITRLQNGLTILREMPGATGVPPVSVPGATGVPPVEMQEFAALDASGQLVAIVGPGDNGTLRPLRNFPLG